MKKSGLAQRILAIAVLLFLGPGFAHGQQPVPTIIIFGVDALSPAGIAAAETPNMDRMCQEGSCTVEARAVLPTKSSPNWMSMVSGVTPSIHGVTSNKWQRDNRLLMPAVTGMEDVSPTIFGELRKQKSEAGIYIAHEWKGFARLVEISAVNQAVAGEGSTDTVNWAIDFLQRDRVDLLFVHIDSVDRAGHDYGHGSAEYIAAVENADWLLGKIYQAVERLKGFESVTMIVSADHGGIDFGHGGESPEEVLIPFFATGRGVRSGYTIEGPVYTMDTAATAARLLGIEIPASWVGRPVCEALDDGLCSP